MGQPRPLGRDRRIAPAVSGVVALPQHDASFDPMRREVSRPTDTPRILELGEALC
jgi:hypothetical protein